MSLQRKTCTLLVLACTAGSALAALSIWTGAGDDSNWTTCQNWLLFSEEFPCYPSSTADDALIPFTAGGYDVDLTGATIGDLIINGTTRFGAEIAEPQLTVTGTVTILGASGGTELTIGEGARIETD